MPKKLSEEEAVLEDVRRAIERIDTKTIDGRRVRAEAADNVIEMRRKKHDR